MIFDVVSTETGGPSSDVTADTLDDSPVLSLINNRLRNLRKKFNRILQMEESLAQGKPLNKEQAELFQSKPIVAARIDELEKLRNPLASAVSEERSLTLQHHASSANKVSCPGQDQEKTSEEKELRAHKELPIDDSKSDHKEGSTMIISDVPITGSSRLSSQIDEQNEGISPPLRKELNETKIKINWKRRCHNYFAENDRLKERVREQERELDEYGFSNADYTKYSILNKWCSLWENIDSEPDPDPDPLIDREDDKDLVFNVSIMEEKEAGIFKDKLDEGDWEAAYKKLKRKNVLLTMEMEAFQSELDARAAIARELPAFGKGKR